MVRRWRKHAQPSPPHHLPSDTVLWKRQSRVASVDSWPRTFNPNHVVHVGHSSRFSIGSSFCASHLWVVSLFNLLRRQRRHTSSQPTVVRRVSGTQPMQLHVAGLCTGPRTNTKILRGSFGAGESWCNYNPIRIRRSTQQSQSFVDSFVGFINVSETQSPPLFVAAEWWWWWWWWWWWTRKG